MASVTSAGNADSAASSVAVIFQVPQAINQEEANKRPKKLKWINLILLGLTQLVGGLTFSLLSPFYTEEASAKGLTVTQCGWVYGSVFITTIAFSPIFGKYIEVIGSRSLFVCGTFVAGATNILFGFLQWVDDSTAFLSLSLAIRIVSAIGEAAFFSSIYPLVTRDAPTHLRSSVLSVMETLHGFGLMIGPFLGGLLYSVDGFYFPFAVCGGTLVACAMLSSFLLTDEGNIAHHGVTASLKETTPLTPTKYIQLLKMPSVTCSCLLLVIAETSVAWYLPTLQPMLKDNFAMGPVATGAMFMLEGATYAIFSPVWGFLLDKKIGPILPLAMGSLGVIVGYFLLGIVSSDIYIIATGLFIQGSCVAATFITTLVFMMEDCVARGANDTEQTRGMVTSLWFISENVAGYIGSTLGGYTYDIIGFNNSTFVVIGMQMLALAIVLALYCVRRKQPSEKQTLLKRGVEDKNANYQSCTIDL